MVVKSTAVVPIQLDLGYLGLFLGLRCNELVAERMAAKGFANVRETHGYVIQHLIERDRSITELAERMEVTQQAASKVVAELLRVGAVEAVIAEDRRSKRIRLSRRGWRAVKIARKLRSELEARLVKTLGPGQYAEAKAILVKCLTELGGLERIRSRRIRPAS